MESSGERSEGSTKGESVGQEIKYYPGGEWETAREARTLAESIEFWFF